MANERSTIVINDQLYTDEADAGEPISVDSSAWFAWLDQPAHRSFTYQTVDGTFTVRREHKGNGVYWYAYRTRHGRLQKAYVGKPADVRAERLRVVADTLADAAHEQPVRLVLFGAPRVERDGRLIAPMPAKAFMLFAYLGAQITPQPREHLLTLLWPESSAEAGRKNLRNLLWRLRTALGAGVVQGNEHITLGTHIWADVRAFTQAADVRETAERNDDSRAVQRAAQTVARLYRGPLLDGVFLADAPDAELWLTGAREQFHERHGQALHDLLAAARRAGRWRDVIAIARTALTQDALLEPMHRALIEAHARLDDRSAALRQYELLRETLARELRVAPVPETELLREAVVGGTIIVSTPKQPTSGISAPLSSPGIAQPFVGRAAECAALTVAWEAAQAGRAQVALLLGEAGIGKSRLWQTWSTQLAHAQTVLAACCLSVMQPLPFAPLLDVLHSAPVKRRLAALAQTAPPSWLVDIARLSPDVRDLLGVLSPPTPLAPVEEQRRVFEALVRSIGPASERPIILFLDDLHWADRATLDWLGYLLHRAQDMPLLLVGACRTEELPAPLDALISQWSRAGVLHRLNLNRLSRAETGVLITELHGDRARADTLHAQSDGNPYFLLELLRAEPGTLPVALTDIIQQRVTRLADQARQVLQAAAILQRDLSFDSLRATSGCNDADTLDALDALLASGLLVEHEDGYSFGHPLIATTVEQSMSTARRTVLHRRVALTLEQHAVNRLDEYAGRLAYHWGEARETLRAAAYAEQAGQHALNIAAPVEAAQFYAQALALEATPARYAGLGRARYRQSDIEGARTAFMQAERGFAQHSDQRGAAHACFELARSYLASSDAVAVVEWVQRGRDYLAHDPDPAAQALASYLLGTKLRVVGQNLLEAAAHLEDAARRAAINDTRTLLPSILLGLGNVRAEQGDLAGAIQSYRDLTVAAQARGDHLFEILGYNNWAYHALLAGDRATAHTAIATGLTLAEQRDLQLANHWLYSTRGEIALTEHDWDGAEMWLRRGLVEANRFGNVAQTIAIRATLALVARGRGAFDSARVQLATAHAEAAALPAPALQAQIAFWLAEMFQQRGDQHAAAHWLNVVEVQLQRHQHPRLRAVAAKLRAQVSPLA